MSNNNTALTVAERQRQKAIGAYFKNAAVVRRFSDMLGVHNSARYIGAVLLAVNSDKNLINTQPESIVTSALRAATLELTVDPALGHAYLIPFKDVCTLTIGYKGLVELANRTGEYTYINATPIYANQVVEEDTISGRITVEGRKDPDQPVIGYLAAFGLRSGFRKELYMSVEEIQRHAQSYSAGYRNDVKKGYGIWVDEKSREAMYLKTPLRLLLTRWGKLDPHAAATINLLEGTEGDDAETEFSGFEDLPDFNVIEAEFYEAEAAKPKKSADELKAELGFSSAPSQPAAPAVDPQPEEPDAPPPFDPETGEILQGSFIPNEEVDEVKTDYLDPKVNNRKRG